MGRLYCSRTSGADGRVQTATHPVRPVDEAPPTAVGGKIEHHDIKGPGICVRLDINGVFVGLHPVFSLYADQEFKNKTSACI